MTQILTLNFRFMIAAVLAAFLLEPAIADASDPLDAARIAIRKREFGTAVRIWRSEAAKGNSEAQYQLGAAYRSGLGVDRDDGKAIRWLRPAAKAGHVAAQYQLGVMLQNGWGVAADRAQALDWFGKASRGGHEKAKERLKSIANSRSRIEASGEARLAAAGDNPNEQLLQAIRLGDLSAAGDALKRGADPNGDPKQRDHTAPLLEAIRLHEGEIVSELIRQGAQVKTRGPGGRSVLMLAVESGGADVVKRVLRSHPDLNARDELGRTALMYAAIWDRDSETRLLLKSGAKANLSLSDGRTALSLALDERNERAAGVLRAAGAVVGRRGSAKGRRAWLSRSLEGQAQSSPPLVAAAAKGKLDLVRELSGSGSVVDVRDGEGHTAVSRAASQGHGKVIVLLLGKGADPNAAAQ
ncbi:MAG: ankyrin repeat domain-containing protein, partial [Deltaproteobacteria bacterium]|nr:ankyrin repeat domain-containing protein [Deltaproteobacteria bacterium]